MLKKLGHAASALCCIGAGVMGLYTVVEVMAEAELYTLGGVLYCSLWYLASVVVLITGVVILRRVLREIFA